MEESGFYFEGWDKAGIQEFGYLIRMISNGQYESIDETTIKDIANDSTNLITEINNELSKKTLTEQERLNISRTTAVANMNNLKNIITSIEKYVECINK